MTSIVDVGITLAEGIDVAGRLSIPTDPIGLIIFAHGSGSTHLSPRNQQVAEVLQAAGFATLLFDLLTEEEAAHPPNRFDIGLLADRLRGATEWALKYPSVSHLPIGYFGASTGASAALQAAVGYGDRIFSVVSRGGRPDLVGEDELRCLTTPTLLIVGGNDLEVLELNTVVYKMLSCRKKLVIIPGATHLFEEPGTLDDVALRATEWFSEHVPQLAE